MRVARRRRDVVMVVSHEASRTGAPKLVPAILEALRAPGDRCILVHRWGGSIKPVLDAAADATVDEPWRRVRVLLRRFSRTRRAAVWVEQLAAFALLWWYRPNLVWCNTTLTACYVRPARRLRIPVVLHVHELERLSRPVLERYSLAGGGLVEGVTLVACSHDAARGLADVLAVPLDTVIVLPSAIDAVGLSSRPPYRASPSVPGSPLHIVACGAVNEGKGTDLFGAMAGLLHDYDPTGFRCTWIGPINDAEMAARTTMVEFVGEVDDPAGIVGSCDIFVLSSRSDAFPLVILEAMALRRAVVAFGVGGVADQLGPTGVVVEAGDVSALAEAAIALADDRDRRIRLGDLACARVLERFDLSAFRAQVGVIAAVSRGPGSVGSGP